MRNLIISTILLLPGFSSPHEETLPFPNIESEFPLLWKVKTGNATFRTNVEFTENEILFGSNGSNYRDFGIYDKLSGVYAIDRSTGKINRHFACERLGDMDVNGIIHYKGKYYFGNDNEEFLCTTSTGKVIWRNLASGDVEHEPTVLQVKQKDYIVYASESGEVRAVDPSSGNTFWSYYTPDYTGLKTGDNRTIFKVQAYFSNTQSFFTKPVLTDLDRDGTKDLVYMSSDDKVYAISGATGKSLWIYDSGTYAAIHLALAGTEDEPALIFSQTEYLSNNDYKNHITTLDRNGKIIRMNRMYENPYGLSLNHFTTSDGETIISSGDSLYISDKKGRLTVKDHSLYFLQENGVFRSGPDFINRNCNEAVFCKTEFRYNKENPRCAIILHQDDNAFNSNAFIEIISLDNWRVLKRLQLPSSSEMSPVIKDVNKDGYLDLVVSCQNEYLYCYNLKIKAN